MTVLCSGHTSHIKPGVNNLQLFGSGLLAQRLAAAGGIYMQALASAVGVLSLNLQDVCTTDPPPMPTFTAAELAAIPNPLIQPDNINALQKMRDALVNLFWFDFCDCDVVATPAPFAFPAAPAGAPDFSKLVNPAGPCIPVQTYSGGGTAPQNGFITTLPNPTTPNVPVQTTGFRVRSSMTQAAGTTATTYTLQLNMTTTGVTNSATSPVFNIDGQLHDWIFTGVPSTFTGGISLQFSGQGFAQGDPYTFTIEAYSGCAPAAQSTVPCCPADMFVNSTLQQILTTVTLLQRQIAPFAYIPGTVHSTVSGNGEFAISAALLGLRVDVPLIPTRAGVIAGDPTRYFDVGEVSLGDADGWFYRRRIDTSSLVWTPKDAQLATRIGYSIPSDVQVTITEIKREHG